MAILSLKTFQDMIANDPIKLLIGKGEVTDIGLIGEESASQKDIARFTCRKRLTKACSGGYVRHQQHDRKVGFSIKIQPTVDVFRVKESLPGHIWPLFLVAIG